MKHVLLLCVCGLGVTGCTVGTPSGFSGGEQWTLPLVGPLEDGVLLTPAMVRGHGPYLFAIDPDANVTELDAQVVQEAELRSGIGPKRVDESDTGQIRFYAEMLQLQIGGLTIDRRDAMVFPVGFYDTEGRHINGILGRDALADSLVFGFDRDQGIATLSTIKSFTPPPQAIEIHYQSVSSESTGVAGTGAGASVVARGGGNFAPMVDSGAGSPSRLGGDSPGRQSDLVAVPRRLVTAQIGDTRMTVHLDLGAAVSQLRPNRWSDARLARVGVKLRVTDEAGTARDVDQAAIAAAVAVAGARSTHTTFVPYLDRRFPDTVVDGSLGLDFFEPYAVYANWDAKVYYLKPRGDAQALLTARLGRWGAALPACPHPGCVTAELGQTGGGVTLSVTRDREAHQRGLEVLLQVTGAPGKEVAPLLVELPAKSDQLSGALPVQYAGATVAVIDVSPFPRTCVDQGGCILPLGLSPAASPPDAPAPSQEPAAPIAKTVAMTKLHQRTGTTDIPPSDAVKQAAAGKPISAAIVKLCLGADGKVESTRLVKSSGVPAYDELLQTTIKASWTFDPFEIDGAPAPVCSSQAFKQP